MTEEEAIESPCIQECRVDQVTGYCVSCLRTLTEISYWETYAPGERRHVMALIQSRRTELAFRPADN